MLKSIFLIISISTLLLAGFQIESFSIKDGNETIKIERENLHICKDVSTSPKNIWDGEFANKDINKACRKSFVTVAGKIQPMSLHEDIKTVGELEVLEFIKNHDDTKALIDSRSGDWSESGTIPSAINIAHFDLEYDPILEDDYRKVMEKLGIEYKDGKHNFKDAKELVVFCNGAWCPQSSWFIKNLISIGYPAKKIKWYRGGLTSWRSLGLTTR